MRLGRHHFVVYPVVIRTYARYVSPWPWPCLKAKFSGVGLGLKYPGIDANYKATGTLRNDV